MKLKAMWKDDVEKFRCNVNHICFTKNKFIYYYKS